MKIAAVTALVSVALATVDPLAEISAHWDDLGDLIDDSLPMLQAADPKLYAVATSVIGGTKITQAFDSDLVQQVATAFPPEIVNNILSRAGITGFTANGKPIPTGGSETSSATSSPSDASTTSGASKSMTIAPSRLTLSASASPTSASPTGKSPSSGSSASGTAKSSTSVASKSTSGATNVLTGSFGTAVAIAVAVALF
ncbi:hypothetical protein DL89DRAFT_270149 [Linderina pennispora]|uniref:Uncharacterized protein n=1 Tax=Linderina pennispora TaxID=61395 RepID=A0A1Y1VZB5_9FUNG|nr:uncharacterized protein DL89DRAFT_270149 [Linderina pennispora]ORX66617.1 hypothetical protein DL89DRAFT_270149 [Linderina pennispora]